MKKRSSDAGAGTWDSFGGQKVRYEAGRRSLRRAPMCPRLAPRRGPASMRPGSWRGSHSRSPRWGHAAGLVRARRGVDARRGVRRRAGGPGAHARHRRSPGPRGPAEGNTLLAAPWYVGWKAHRSGTCARGAVLRHNKLLTDSPERAEGRGADARVVAVGRCVFAGRRARREGIARVCGRIRSAREQRRADRVARAGGAPQDVVVALADRRRCDVVDHDRRVRRRRRSCDSRSMGKVATRREPS